MAARALSDLFGRREPLPPVAEAALADLRRLAADRPEPAGPAEVLAAALAAAFAVAPTEAALYTATLPDPIEPGDGPIFRRLPPPPDDGSLARRGREICAALGTSHPDSATLRAALRRGTLDLAGWANLLIAGEVDSIGESARSAGIDPGLAASVLRLALLPSLAACSAAVAPRRTARVEPTADCPHCGLTALLAESRGLEGLRFLRCGTCAADWPADRLRCPHCGEADARRLAHLAVEGEASRYRRVDCATCGATLKVIATLAALSPPALLVAELATVHLDWLEA